MEYRTLEQTQDHLDVIVEGFSNGRRVPWVIVNDGIPTAMIVPVDEATGCSMVTELDAAIGVTGTAR